jgi:hypothetical protein
MSDFEQWITSPPKPFNRCHTCRDYPELLEMIARYAEMRRKRETSRGVRDLAQWLQEHRGFGLQHTALNKHINLCAGGTEPEVPNG